MFKFKRLLSLVVTITIVTMMSSYVYAYDISDLEDAHSYFTEEEQRRIEEIIQSPNSEDWLGVVV